MEDAGKNKVYAAYRLEELMRTKKSLTVSQWISFSLKILFGVFVAALVLGMIADSHAVSSLVARNASPIGYICLTGIVLYLRTKFVDCMFDGM